MLVQIAELQQNMIALVKILPAILRHKNNCCCKSRFNSLFDSIFFFLCLFSLNISFLFSCTECDVLPNRIGFDWRICYEPFLTSLFI